jgi:hypothetical protein
MTKIQKRMFGTLALWNAVYGGPPSEDSTG